jgi:hypothetical protein
MTLMPIFANWPVKIGQVIKRRELHQLVGGAHQWGITSCMNRTAVLVFSNPHKARKYGYDRWEGSKPNGRFDYTGQGPLGDQDVTTRANKSLLGTKARGLPVHLFTSQGTSVTYVGEYELADDPYRWEEAPDERGLLRRVVVFHLVQVEVDNC